MVYGYDGGSELLEHLEEYFDTPEHAAFAIELVTNPRWPGNDHPIDRYDHRRFEREQLPRSYDHIKALLEKHADLLKSKAGANALAILGMRVALRMGDPPAARKLGEAVPENADVRGDPDFNWMLASAEFLAHEYGSAEQSLLRLFRSPRASLDQKAAAAYGLCGVYRKTRNVQEQLFFALWLRTTARENNVYVNTPAGLSDFSVYWASSGWDLDLLLDAEAPLEVLSSFVENHPRLANLKLVQYALAVRLARVNRYQEAADVYQSIQASLRAARMRRLAGLYAAANQTGADREAILSAKFRLAEFLSANPERVYFNDRIWNGLQRYSFQASTDSRLTRSERDELIAMERNLKDEQEERWRAYLIFREVVRDSGDAALRRRAAGLAVRCLRGIRTDRFGREEEIRTADLELSASAL
jgi:hypothetical protein